MNLFDAVGECFFKPLTSHFKTIYFDCITIIYRSYQSELSHSVDREILVTKLADYFEESNFAEIEFEDEKEVLRDSRAKATMFLRKLKAFGWVDYETANDHGIKVIMPDHAVTLARALLDITDPQEPEYQGELSLIYATLTNEELLARPYPQVLKPVYDRTRALFDDLKKLNTSIKKRIDEMTADKSAEEIIEAFFKYHTEIGSKAYHRIQTEENVSRFRNTIINRLKYILETPDVFALTVRGYQNIEHESDYDTAAEDVKARLVEIIDSFRSYDEIASEIEKKHAKYIRNALERAKFLLSSANDVEGKISTILQYMADFYNEEEQNNLAEDAPDDICALFNIFPQGFLSRESLKAIPVSRKATTVDDVFDPGLITAEERELHKMAIAEKNKARFSQKNIEKYVDELLAEKARVSAAELPTETKRDIFRIAFISLYGHSPKSKYTVVPTNRIISAHGFRCPDFEIKRRIK